jgi:hypothetical protein
MAVFKEVRGAGAWPGADASRDAEFSEIFRQRHRSEKVSPNVHVEPEPRIPDYDEIARLVRKPRSSETPVTDRTNQDDAGRRPSLPKG